MAGQVAEILTKYLGLFCSSRFQSNPIFFNTCGSSQTAGVADGVE